MGKPLLPASLGSLALSLATHAGVLTGIVALSGSDAAVAPNLAGRAAGPLLVSLVPEVPVQPGRVPIAIRRDPLSPSLSPPRSRSSVPQAPSSPPASPPPQSLAPVVPVPARTAVARIPSPAAGRAIDADEVREIASAVEALTRVAAAAETSGPPDGVERDAGRASRPEPEWPGSGEVDRAARPRRPIRPGYPPRARRSGEESTVVVEAWVDEAGGVAFATVLRSGGSEFDESAERAVRRSPFRPARLAGREVASRVALRIHFQIYD